ncbi:hypothetical protein EHS25_003521 [Saitozyma podzolica]|uniref:Uncharacterized protein n=1 Tax=Saitozyma podzolica TaxID=1890683 RepID=A0A427Y7G0_9TREE|nr:hypothetical protein EHS25_003521 [Saitozyma podzolica]
MASTSTSSSSAPKASKPAVSMGRTRRASRTRGSGIRESTLPFTGRSASPDPCLSTVLLHGPPGGACGRSEYGDGSLIQLGRRKTSTIVTPETIRDFTSHTLEQLGLDPMYPAALCELVRSKTLTKRPQDHLSAILASLGSACAGTVGGKRLTVVKAVPDKKGTKGPLTPAELAVRDTIVVEWKKLVPFANEDDMADFFLQPSTFDESRNARPLVEAFLVTILGECPLSFTHSSAGYRTGRLWITIDELRDVSMARQSLENELQRAILEGKAFRQSRFADGSLCRASRAMTANFATNSSDRQALLRAYREVSQVGTTLQDTADAVGHRSLFCGHDAGYRGARQIQEEPKFCLLPQPRWGGSMPLRASSFIYGTAWKYNPACTINERNAIIASIKSWAKSDKLGQVQYHSWTPREDLACFGFSDHAVIAEALRAHGMSPSLIAVTWRVSRRGAIAIPTVDRLKRSCPRWWKAMGLPATGKEALEGAIVRGAASGAFTGETKAVTKAYDGIDQALFDEDLAATYFPTDAELAGSDAGFESYLRRDVLESGSTEEQLYRVARTKVAVLRRWAERLIEEQMAQTTI